MIKIYTDGSCTNEWEAKQKGLIASDEGGIGIAIYRDGELEKEISENYLKTTNNKMELLAILKALDFVTEDTEIISDSQYALKSIGGYFDLDKKVQVDGWDRSNLSGVKNASYIKALLKKIKSVRKKHKLSFTWVRGHSGCVGNEKADELSCKRNNLKIDLLNK